MTKIENLLQTNRQILVSLDYRSLPWDCSEHAL